MGIFNLFRSKKRKESVSSKKERINLSQLNDPLKLAEIAKNGPNSKTRKAAVKRISTKHKEILQDIIFEATDYKVKIASVKKMNDQKMLSEIYKKCIEVDISKSVRSALVKRMTDTEILAEISEKDSHMTVRKAAKRRIFDLKPKITSYTVKVDCPHCSNPVMLNGPVLNTKCTYCLSELTIPQKLWGYILRVKDSIMYSHLCGFRNVEIKSYLTQVRCSSCNGDLDVGGIPGGSTDPIRCPQCNVLNSAIAVPEWMKRFSKYSARADQIFCATSGGEEPIEEHAKKKPVLFSCMQCGGSLKITTEMPRVMSCTYCGASQYLPDELWRALHPAKKKREWFVRWSKAPQ
jgi:hypothetical protein